MLVTTHDLNFVMGFIKEDEIYNPQNGVSDYFSSIFSVAVNSCVSLELILNLSSFAG